MTDAHRARAEEVLLSALAMPVAERVAWVRRACSEEPKVLAEVLSLLAFTEGSDVYLSVLAAGAGAPFSLDRRLDPGREGDRVGNYKLVQVIGRGGMGTVYRAERVDGEFDQRVAIKLLRRGLDTDDILARFRTERQILASLSHPHIAQLFDGGATETGRPYLVMELVEGVAITEFCDAQRLAIQERLRLFVQVTRAVQHAHGKFIAHRDIKPSNILVTSDGAPKLLDFGIARLLDDAYGAEANAITRTGLRLLTPEYASPEQIRGEPVSTASDVYQLGVLLHQLLVGQRPYQLRGCTAQEIERIFVDGHRSSPSATLVPDPKTATAENGGPTRGGARASTREEPNPDRIARQRSTDVRRLRARLRGDLDTILLKAVHPDRRQRYASAGELADDIERHLDGQPILARPPSIRYRTGKFIRRHRMAVALAALAVTGTMTAAGWDARRTAEVSRERDRILYEAARERASVVVDRLGAGSRQGSRATAINDHGIVVGIARNEYGDRRAVRWTVDPEGRVTGPERLDRPHMFPEEREFFDSEATAINNQGAIVGQRGIRSFYPLIYYEGQAQRLSRPPWANTVSASSINDSGWVAGEVGFQEAGDYRSFGLVWLDPLNPDEQPVQLPPLRGDRSSRGIHISDSGVVGGNPEHRTHFVLWRVGPDGSVSEPASTVSGRVKAMNNDGAMAGDFPDATTGWSRSRPYFGPAGAEEIIELKLLSGDFRGAAQALSSPASGEPTLLVGFSTGPEGPRATFWRAHTDGSVDGPMTLGAADGYSLSVAFDVNARGWIVGQSMGFYNDPYSGEYTEPEWGEMATLWRPLQDGSGYAAVPLGGFGPGPSASFVHVCSSRGVCNFADTSTPGSSAMIGRSWDSGAGQTDDVPEATFAYRAPGRFSVKLKVTDASGRQDEAQIEINCARHLLGGVRCR